jgi:hypothetical protein
MDNTAQHLGFNLSHFISPPGNYPINFTTLELRHCEITKGHLLGYQANMDAKTSILSVNPSPTMR